MPNPITADCLAEIKGISHGFFTREGGVSDGIYGSLNCGHGSKDDTAKVAENRARVVRHLGAGSAPLLTCYQVHSADVVVVTEPWDHQTMPKADGLVTKQPGIVLGALAADCAPVLFADPVARIIGAAHAGWKGALGGILEATIATMERTGAKRNRIRAVLGPCIGPTAYEVGPEFVNTFTTVDAKHARFFHSNAGGPRPHFDLPNFVLSRLELTGIDTIESCTDCTYSVPERYFSYRRTTHRREPDYGRQISAIMLL